MNGQILTNLVQAFGPTATILFLVIIYLLRERKNGKSSVANPSMGITKNQMSDMYKWTAQMHEWHDTDDPESGQKRWLLGPQMVTELKGIRADLSGMTIEIRDGHKRLRESIDVQTGAVVKNTATLEQLETKIAKFIK